MRKIIVTGHNGYIGAVLAPLLVEKGYEVVGIDTSYYDEACELFAPGFKDIKQIKKDVREIEEKDIDKAYAVCHLSALSNDPIGALDKELTYDINYKASLRLAELSKKVGVEKFIFSSSCSMYGKSGDDILTEEAVFSPVTAYAESKVLSEKFIKPLGSKDFSVTFLRNSTAYGISPKLRIDLVVNNLVGWALTTGNIKIMSDGTPWRPLIHVEDIAQAFLAVIEASKETISGESFNVGTNSENYQVKDIAFLVKEVMPECNVIITGENGMDSRSYKVDFSKIKRKMPHFKPKWGLKKGIEQICDYYKRYGMDSDKFNGKCFIRLKQIKYLLDSHKLDSRLYWRKKNI